MNDIVNDIVKAFAEIEKHDLKPAVVICTVCGCVLAKETKPCVHLLELAEGCSEWFKS